MKWVLLFSLTMLLPMHSLAEIYQWVDEQGQMHFGSVPPRLQEPYQPGDISRNATPSHGSIIQQARANIPSKQRKFRTTNTAEHRRNPRATETPCGGMAAEKGAIAASGSIPAGA